MLQIDIYVDTTTDFCEPKLQFAYDVIVLLVFFHIAYFIIATILVSKSFHSFKFLLFTVVLSACYFLFVLFTSEIRNNFLLEVFLSFSVQFVFISQSYFFLPRILFLSLTLFQTVLFIYYVSYFDPEDDCRRRYYVVPFDILFYLIVLQYAIQHTTSETRAKDIYNQFNDSNLKTSFLEKDDDDENGNSTPDEHYKLSIV